MLTHISYQQIAGGAVAVPESHRQIVAAATLTPVVPVDTSLRYPPAAGAFGLSEEAERH